MASGTVEFLVLTSGMYVVLLMVTVSLSIMSGSVLQQATQTRLNEISNEIAADIINAYSLCYQTSSGQAQTFRPIEIPSSVSMNGYVITLELENNLWVVHVCLETTQTIYAESPLWKISSWTCVETGNGTITINSYQITYSATIHSGTSAPGTKLNPVVWAVRSGGKIRVGIGVIKS
ncbi:MAG TPA: hypothetical protein VEG31_00070 [Thermoproteota archaeon]|nr:hypothetical protein [Thermoproteota archaeon]